MSNLLKEIEDVKRGRNKTFRVVEAKEALNAIQVELGKKGIMIENILRPHCSKEFKDEISLRAFKIALNTLSCLTPR